MARGAGHQAARFTRWAARKAAHGFETVDDFAVKLGGALFSVEKNINRNMPLTVRQNLAADLAWGTTIAVPFAAGGAVGAYRKRQTMAQTRKLASDFESDLDAQDRIMAAGRSAADERTLKHYLFDPDTGVYGKYIAAKNAVKGARDEAERSLATGELDRRVRQMEAVWGSVNMDDLLVQGAQLHRSRVLDAVHSGNPNFDRWRNDSDEQLSEMSNRKFYESPVETQMAYVKEVVGAN